MQASVVYPRNHTGANFLDMATHEFQSLPVIETLDEYIHFKAELETMRARSNGEVIPARFAMELALYIRLCDYESALGLPVECMPQADGNGGVRYPSPIPDEWIA